LPDALAIGMAVKFAALPWKFVEQIAAAPVILKLPIAIEPDIVPPANGNLVVSTARALIGSLLPSKLRT
jgi:hypothetical protein